MKVWTCTFNGYWPVGAAAVIVAGTEERAKQLMEQQLTEMKLPQDAIDVQELLLDAEKAVILLDGNY